MDEDSLFVDVDTFGDPVELADLGNKPQPYPIEMFPKPIQEAITDIQKCVGVPVEIAAASVLGSLSAAIQAKVNVDRGANIAPNPVSLILLTLFESGGRKSSAAAKTKKSFIDFEQAERERTREDVLAYKASHRTWELEVQGVESAIKATSAKKNKSQAATELSMLENELHQLLRTEPVRPTGVRMLYGDVTTEALVRGLSSGYPSAYLETAEGSSFFGSHATKEENSASAFAFQCVMWDGGMFQQDRIGRMPEKVSNSRLTVNISIQPEIFKDVYRKMGDRMRYIGLFSRCLMCMPSDEIFGTRLIDPMDPVVKTPAVDNFNDEIRRILSRPVEFDEKGISNLLTLKFDEYAQGIWVDYYNSIELEMKRSGRYELFRDIASKSADNACRIAGLFHYFCWDGEGDISVDAIVPGCELAKWYLEEQKRIFGYLGDDAWSTDLFKVKEWLVKFFQAKEKSMVSFREIYQNVIPKRLRSPSALIPYIEELQNLNILRMHRDETGRPVQLNPKLLKFGQ